MEEPSIFTRIIKGELPAHRVYEDDKVIAFLTIQPITDGHTLVVPKKQIDQIWDMDDEDYQYLWLTAKKIAKHISESLHVDRVGVVVKGFEVPHVHIHLIPTNHDSYLSFDPFPVPPVADNKHLASIAEEIRMP